MTDLDDRTSPTTNRTDITTEENPLSSTFNYSNTETVAVGDLQIGDVVFKPHHPDRPYRVRSLQKIDPNARVQVRGTGAYPAGWICILATSVYAKWGVSAGTFGTFDPTTTLDRAVLEP